jgi:hypothetical protein
MVYYFCAMRWGVRNSVKIPPPQPSYLTWPQPPASTALAPSFASLLQYANFDSSLPTLPCVILCHIQRRPIRTRSTNKLIAS